MSRRDAHGETAGRSDYISILIYPQEHPITLFMKMEPDGAMGMKRSMRITAGAGHARLISAANVFSLFPAMEGGNMKVGSAASHQSDE